MSISYLTSINMNNLQILNLQLENYAGVKGGVVAGSFYYNSSIGFPMWYDGTNSNIVTTPTSTTPQTLTVGNTAAVGTSNQAARADHVHAIPGLATGSTSGFMTAAQYNLLTNATNSNTVSTLVLRDSSGRAQFVDPVNPQDAATKNYVDTSIQGLSIKDSVVAATTVAGTLASSFANTSVIDGVTLATGNRILIKNQASALENGIYTVNASGAPTRSTDFNTWAEVVGAFVFVETGTANADTGWVSTAAQTGTIGSTAINFTQFSGAGSYSMATSGTGTSIYGSTSGNQFILNSLAVGSTKLSISLASNTISLDVNQANLTISAMGGTLPVSMGGTNITSYTQYAMLYASTTGILSQVTPNTTATVMYLAQSTANSNAPTWGQITSLGTISTGVWNGTAITYGYGGTGLTSPGASAGNLRWNGSNAYTIDTTAYLSTATAASTYSPIAGSSSIVTIGAITSGSVPANLVSTGTAAASFLSAAATAATFGVATTAPTAIQVSSAGAITISPTTTGSFISPSGQTNVWGSNATTLITGSAAGALTLAVVPTLPSQTANYFWAAPSGSAGAPTFRLITSADIPAGVLGYTSLATTTVNGFMGHSGTTASSPVMISGSVANQVPVVTGAGASIAFGYVTAAVANNTLTAAAATALTLGSNAGTQITLSAAGAVAIAGTTTVDVTAGSGSALTLGAGATTGIISVSATSTAASIAVTSSAITFGQPLYDINSGVQYDPFIVVSAMSLANLTLSGTQTIDTVVLTAGQLVLAAGQSTATTNGVYVVAAGAWSRAVGFSTATQIQQREIYVASVSGGNTYGGTWWTCSTPGYITVGSTSLSFAQVPDGIGTASYQASAGNHTLLSHPQTGMTSGQVLQSSAATTYGFNWITTSNFSATGAYSLVAPSGQTMTLGSNGTTLITGSAAGVLTFAVTPTLPSQTQNTFFAAPYTGGAGVPTFRSINVADLPLVTTAYGGTGTTSWTAGSVVYASTSSLLSGISPNATATTMVLTQSSSGAPTWQTLPNISGAQKIFALWSTATTSFAVSNTTSSVNVSVTVTTVATGAIVMCDVVVTTSTVTCTMAVAPAANAYTITIIG